MKKLFITLVILCMTFGVTEAENVKKKEKKQENTELTADGKTIKKGWNVAPFPSIGYNSDIGFTIGALCELFNYGDGSTYPQYRHKFNGEASYSTKGQITTHFFYDSSYLIP